MTFTLDAQAQPSNSPPRVLLTATESDPDLSLQSVSLFRDGAPLRFETAVTGDTAIAYDYDAPFGVPLVYRADGVEVGTVQDFAETWAGVGSWTGAGWSAGSGIVSSTVAGAVIYRDVSSGSVLQMDVVSPSNLTYQLTDSADTVIVSVLVSPDGTVTLSGSTASKVTGSGSFTLSLAGSTAAIEGTGWSTSVLYSGSPTRIRLVAPLIATPVASYGTSGTGVGQLSQPIGLAFNTAGTHFYVADAVRRKILKFTTAGAFVSEFGTSGTGSGQMIYPYGIAVDASDNIWVADYTNDKVLKFDSAGAFLLQSGGTGTGNGQFDGPTAIAVKSTGNVVVTDFKNNRVQELNSSGVYQSKFTVANGPNGVVIGASDDIIVTTWTGGDVLRYNASGVLQDTFDEVNLSKPNLLARDSSGNVYVTDWNNSRVVKFDSSGVLVGTFGGPGTGPGQFQAANGILVTSGGDIFVADYSTTNRVQKFTQAGGSTDDITVRVDLSEDPLEVTATDTETLTPTGATAGAWLTNAATPDLAILIDVEDCQDNTHDFYITGDTRAQTVIEDNSVALSIEGSADVLTVALGPRIRETWTLEIACKTESARQELAAALANSAPVGLRFMPSQSSLGLVDGFYAIGRIATSRDEGPAVNPTTIFTLPLTPSRAPKFKPTAQWTWDKLMQTGMTWDDVMVNFTSWNDLLLGPN